MNLILVSFFEQDAVVKMVLWGMGRYAMETFYRYCGLVNDNEKSYKTALGIEKN